MIDIEKACNDCKFRVSRSPPPFALASYCSNIKAAGFDIVVGKTLTTVRAARRQDGACGPNAALFEVRAKGWLRRLLS